MLWCSTTHSCLVIVYTSAARSFDAFFISFIIISSFVSVYFYLSLEKLETRVVEKSTSPSSSSLSKKISHSTRYRVSFLLGCFSLYFCCFCIHYLFEWSLCLIYLSYCKRFALIKINTKKKTPNKLLKKINRNKIVQTRPGLCSAHHQTTAADIFCFFFLIWTKFQSRTKQKHRSDQIWMFLLMKCEMTHELNGTD